MIDIVGPAKRSEMMAGIKRYDTKPEMKVRRYLHSLGFRYVLHKKELPGKPDIVFPKHRAVVFVHGCFWHSHEGCKYAAVPKTREAFWSDKLKSNQVRDRKVVRELLDSGWRVLIVWECALRSSNCELHSVVAFLNSKQSYCVISASSNCVLY